MQDLTLLLTLLLSIFIEASEFTGELSNAVFYMGTCLVMLQYFAVYITLSRK